jgi:DNA mismatch endonuclease (patch repair protein)
LTSHEQCRLFRPPKSNEKFWNDKIASNKKRDTLKYNLLLESGWKILEIWECSLKGKRGDKEKVVDLAETWLHGNNEGIYSVRYMQEKIIIESKEA